VDVGGQPERIADALVVEELEIDSERFVEKPK
jgi:hypothetical protein